MAVANWVVGDDGFQGAVCLLEYPAPVWVIAAENGASFLAWFDLVLLELREHLVTAVGGLPEVRPLAKPLDDDEDP